MATRAKGAHQQLRQQLAYLAAKLVAEDGVSDYLIAKRKAAERLGVTNRQQLPSNAEIAQALEDYQRIFQSDTQPKRLARMRRIALKAMEFLESFRPRLCGPVLEGTAYEHSEITLHLYADAPETVALQLLDRDIPYSACERRIRCDASTNTPYPAYRFLADGIAVVLVIFPEKAKNLAPLSPTDGRPMQRATITNLRSLLGAGTN
jgi:hypothetical protein